MAALSTLAWLATGCLAQRASEADLKAVVAATATDAELADTAAAIDTVTTIDTDEGADSTAQTDSQPRVDPDSSGTSDASDTPDTSDAFDTSDASNASDASVVADAIEPTDSDLTDAGADTAAPPDSEMDAAQPDTSGPDTAVPDTAAPDTAAPDAAEPDTSDADVLPTQVCTPGAKGCVGNVTVVCAQDGSKLATVDDCAKVGQLCVAGACALKQTGFAGHGNLGGLTASKVTGYRATELRFGVRRTCKNGFCAIGGIRP